MTKHTQGPGPWPSWSLARLRRELVRTEQLADGAAQWAFGSPNSREDQARAEAALARANLRARALRAAISKAEGGKP